MTKRILTGMRPTGALHLGHYLGALKQWLDLESKGEYGCFYLIADAQALTDHAESPKLIQQSIIDVALDWLAVGLDPVKSAFSLQSSIPETYELEHYLACVTPQSWVDRNPTIKAEIAQIKGQRGGVVTSAFMRYPVSQAADILNVAGREKTSILVPIGEDQIPHIELCRDIAGAFNRIYGEILPLPTYKIGTVGRLVGTDGSDKMSKSLGNVIMLSDPAAEVKKKVMKMYTDPNRVKADTPGTVEGNVVFSYLDIFDKDQWLVEQLKTKYRAGTISDVEVKRRLIDVLNDFLAPIRLHRSDFAKDLGQVNAFIKDGTRRERELAAQTLDRVKAAMGMMSF